MNKECQQCFRQIPDSAFICMHCGADTRTRHIIRDHVTHAFDGHHGMVLTAIVVGAVCVYLVYNYII